MEFIGTLPSYLLGAMGLLFFLPPLIFLLVKLSFRLGSRKALGTVTRIEKNFDADSGSTLIQPVLEFLDENGTRTEVKTGIGHGLRYLPRVGDTRKIYYRPQRFPLKFQVVNRGLWQVSGILMLTGLMLMLPVLIRIFFK